VIPKQILDMILVRDEIWVLSSQPAQISVWKWSSGGSVYVGGRNFGFEMSGFRGITLLGFLREEKSRKTGTKKKKKMNKKKPKKKNHQKLRPEDQEEKTRKTSKKEMKKMMKKRKKFMIMYVKY
jgi:hypothetical protein